MRTHSYIGCMFCFFFHLVDPSSLLSNLNIDVANMLWCHLYIFVLEVVLFVSIHAALGHESELKLSFLTFFRHQWSCLT